MGYPHCHTHPFPQLTRVLRVNTPRVAHSFIHSFIHSFRTVALTGVQALLLISVHMLLAAAAEPGAAAVAVRQKHRECAAHRSRCSRCAALVQAPQRQSLPPWHTMHLPLPTREPLLPLLAAVAALLLYCC
jgi:hypothetical protein